MEQGELPELIFADNVPQEDLASRVILTPRNDESLTVNDSILDRHHGDAPVYCSADVDECLVTQMRQSIIVRSFFTA